MEEETHSIDHIEFEDPKFDTIELMPFSNYKQGICAFNHIMISNYSRVIKAFKLKLRMGRMYHYEMAFPPNKLQEELSDFLLKEFLRRDIREDCVKCRRSLLKVLREPGADVTMSPRRARKIFGHTENCQLCAALGLF